MSGNLSDYPFEFIVSAPSGTGKTTLFRSLKKEVRLEKVVSLTTRPKRLGEVEGVDYSFVTEEYFKNKIQEGFFLEWADVYGHLYGTPNSFEYKDIDFLVYEVDVKGFFSIRQHKPNITSIFIIPPSLESLKSRLLMRQPLMPKEELKKRLSSAAEEIQHASHYDYVVCNENLSEALESLMLIFKCERIKTASNANLIHKLSH